MASNTEIANMALSTLGVSKEIAALETEKSAEAAACRRFYDTIRDLVLRDFPWPFATRFATLALVADNPDETDEWAYSYRYPTDCVTFRRFQTGVANESQDQKVPHKIGEDDDGQLIYTNVSPAKIEYTRRITQESRFPADFVVAFSKRLAVEIAPRITRGDPFKLARDVMRLYLIDLTAAQSNAANEENPGQPPQSELENSRQ